MALSGNPVPFVLINGLCFGLAWLLGHSVFYRNLLEEAAPGRASMVDGLRGWLALGVFFTHAAGMYDYVVAGHWGTVPFFYGMTGQIGVSLFFMITGFLFWGRVLRAAGPLDAEALYFSRLRRLVPMYLFSVLMVLLVAGILSGFALQVGPAELLHELRAWFSFGFMVTGDLNGVRGAHHINAVYWTLAFEWTFYLALPLLAFLAHRGRSCMLVPLAFLYGLQAPVTLNFLCGALAAIIAERKVVNGWLQRWFLAPLPVAALLAVLLFPSAYALAPIGLMFVFFLFVTGGNSLFGLLASRPARLLGTVSYSIYLVHCIVLYCIMHAADTYVPLASMTPAAYWLLAAAAATLTVLVATVTYRCIEHPFIARPAAASSLPGLDKEPRAMEVVVGHALPGRTEL